MYIWGFNLADEREQRLSILNEPPAEYLRSIDWRFILYYVGKASNLRTRLSAHAKDIESGWERNRRYWYYHHDSLHNFSRYQKPANNAEVDLNNWRVFPNTPMTRRQYLDPSVRERLREHIKFMLGRTWFSYAELDDPNDRKLVESLLFHKLDGYKKHERRKGSCTGIEVIHSGHPFVRKSLEDLMKVAAADKNREPSGS